MKQNSWFFDTVSKIDKTLVKWTKRKWRPKLIKLEVKKWDINEIQKIIRISL